MGKEPSPTLQARGSPLTSATTTALSPTLQQRDRHRPWRCQHLGKGLSIDLGDINCTFANTSTRGSPPTSAVPTLQARGSPSTLVTSTALSPTLRRGARHQPRQWQHLGKAFAINLGHVNYTLTKTSARGSPFDLGEIGRTFTNTSARDSPSTSASSTAPSPTLQQGARH